MAYKAADNDRTYSDYEKKILKILESPVLDFLSDSKNVGVFDVEQGFGRRYCEQIDKEFPHIAADFRSKKYEHHLSEFSKIGCQTRFYSYELESFITPNASRYIYHALIISKYLKEKFRDGSTDILEIGGGYGGLCYWLRIFANTIGKYTIVDLPVVCQLQKRCLGLLNTSSESITEPSLLTSANPIFVISNYGYSEFNLHYQNLYKETIIKRASAGFMIWNNWTGIYLFTDLPMRIEPERPVFEDIPNKFIYF